jgi:hypothetical protein
MTNDQQQRQMAQDIRFLAIRAGKPIPLVVVLALLLFGMFFFAAFLTEVASIVMGPATHHHQRMPR